VSRIQADEITNATGTGAPGFPFGVPASTEVPFRLHATINIPDARLHIEPSEISDYVGAGRVPYPINGEVPVFAATTINFQTGGIVGSSVDITFPTGTVNYYRRVGFVLTSVGGVKAYFTAEASTLIAVAEPGTLFLDESELPLGWVDIQNTDGNTAYKTADSVTNIIQNKVLNDHRIHIFTNGKVLPTQAGINIGGNVSGGTPGSVLFVDSLNQIAQDNVGLYFDPTTNRLGIGTATPGSSLSITSTEATNPASIIFHSGLSVGLRVELTNASNSSYALELSTSGTGGAAYFENDSVDATLVLTNADTSGAVIQFLGATSGSIDIAVPNAITSYALVLPTIQGGVDTFLQNDGSGNLTWATAATSTSLQLAYDGGNEIETDGLDVIISGDAGLEISADLGLSILGNQGLKVGGPSTSPRIILDAPTGTAQLEQIFLNLTLLENTSGVLADLVYDAAIYNSVEITYSIVDTVTNHTRTGRFLISTNGVDVSFVDTGYSETADLGVEWTADIDLGNVEITYTNGINNKIFLAEVKRFKI